MARKGRYPPYFCPSCSLTLGWACPGEGHSPRRPSCLGASPPRGGETVPPCAHWLVETETRELERVAHRSVLPAPALPPALSPRELGAGSTLCPHRALTQKQAHPAACGGADSARGKRPRPRAGTRERRGGCVRSWSPSTRGWKDSPAPDACLCPQTFPRWRSPRPTSPSRRMRSHCSRRTWC